MENAKNIKDWSKNKIKLERRGTYRDNKGEGDTARSPRDHFVGLDVLATFVVVSPTGATPLLDETRALECSSTRDATASSVCRCIRSLCNIASANGVPRGLRFLLLLDS